jgi:hypothetical protein
MKEIYKLSDAELIVEFIKEVRMYIRSRHIKQYGTDLYSEIWGRYIYHKMSDIYRVLYGDKELIKYIRNMDIMRSMDSYG